MRKRDLSPDRQARLKRVPGRSGAYALLPPPTPRQLPIQGRIDRLAEAREALARLDGLVRALPNADLVTPTLARREAVLSSQLEGTKTEIDELLTYEATGHPEEASADTRVTANYVTALEVGLEALRTDPNRPVDEALIQAIHRELMTGITNYPGEPGRYRTQQNWIGGSSIYDARLVPPLPEDVPACMAELAGYLADPHDPEQPYTLGIVTRLAIVHAQFETIHPFTDGNGRVGRILMPLMLAKEGYPPLYIAGHLCRHRREYFDALLGVQLKDDWGPWLELLAETVEISAREALTLTQALLATKETMEGKVADARADSLLRRMPAVLIAHPMLSARSLSKIEGVSFPTAKNALEQLAKRGLVERRKAGREQGYVATAVAAILAGDGLDEAVGA